MSEHYKALTRKYRPSSFEDIVSQSHVSETLVNAIRQNRLSHAYLFSGPRGVGKTTMARVLARAINQVGMDVDAEHLNQTLNIVEIDAASNNSVDDARHIREQVRIPPQNGDYKVFIIDEVHMLSKAAFNALLKTLEEPPAYAIFIFATTEPHKVLPTILSRVQRFDFKRLSVSEISSRLVDISEKEHIQIDEDSINLIARKADGALRDALGLMDQAIALCGLNIQIRELEKALNVIGMDRLYELVKKIAHQDAPSTLHYIDQLLHDGYDIQELVVNLTEYFRNLYIIHGGQHPELVEATDTVVKQLKELSGLFGEEDILRLLHLCSDTQMKLKEAHQPRIQLEIAFLKMAKMPRGRSVNELITLLEDLKKKAPEQLLSTITSSIKTEIQGNGSTSTPLNPIHSNSLSEEKAKPVEIDQEITSSEVMNEEPKPVELTEAPQPKSDVLPAKSLNRLFDKAALKKSSSTSSTNANKVIQKRRTEPISLGEIQEHWTKWNDSASPRFSTSLKVILSQTIPIKLIRQQLILQINDHFAKEALSSNRKDIEKSLLDYFGSVLNIDSEIVATTEEKIEELDPIDQLMRLQETEPKIKTIIELFGAEPEF